MKGMAKLFWLLVVLAFALTLTGCPYDDPDARDYFEGTWKNDELGIRIVAKNGSFTWYETVAEEGGDTWEKAAYRGAYHTNYSEYYGGGQLRAIIIDVNLRNTKDNPWNEWVDYYDLPDETRRETTDSFYGNIIDGELTAELSSVVSKKTVVFAK